MKLKSREYKLMLHPEKFAGDAVKCRTAIGEFWKEARHRMLPDIVAASAEQDIHPAKQRSVLFLDTQDKALYRDCDLVLRMRRPFGSEADWEATLKFRHGDRLLSEASGIRPRKGDQEGKFEEDVKVVPRSGQPGFWTLFSRSAEAKFERKAAPGTVADCLAPFTGLREDRLPSRQTAVVTVAGIEIREHVFEVGGLRLPNDIEAKCAVILWWRKGETFDPYAAEFSFRFDLQDGRVSEECARAAWAAITLLCRSPWADPQGPTKTALVYGAD